MKEKQQEPRHRTDFDLDSPFKLPNNRAIRTDDKRLVGGTSHPELKPYQFKPGENQTTRNGIVLKPRTKPLSEALLRRLEKEAEANGRTLAEEWAETIINAAMGRTKISPSQASALQLIRDTIEGKPGIAEDDSDGEPQIVWDKSLG